MKLRAGDRVRYAYTDGRLGRRVGTVIERKSRSVVLVEWDGAPTRTYPISASVYLDADLKATGTMRGRSA